MPTWSFDNYRNLIKRYCHNAAILVRLIDLAFQITLLHRNTWTISEVMSSGKGLRKMAKNLALLSTCCHMSLSLGFVELYEQNFHFYNEELSHIVGKISDIRRKRSWSWKEKLNLALERSKFTWHSLFRLTWWFDYYSILY